MKSKETFNQTVGLNVCKYRKLHGYTQASLAEKLNYSDKAVAKWESGESLPEPFVLYQLCEIFGVTLNDLTSDKKKVKMPIGKFKQMIIPLLADCIVWLVSLLSFTLLNVFSQTQGRFWLSFTLAIPVTFILFLVFSCIYKKPIFQFVSITGIIWSTLLNVHLFTYYLTPFSFYVYFLGIPVQIAFVLTYGYLFFPKIKLKK